MLVGDGPVEHVSIMDAPEPVEEPEVVVEEPEEEYDPYLERIEEAIAAVTGLPRRRPGAAPPTPEPVAEPAAPVSMWGESAALGAAFEPVALPSQYDESPVTSEEPAAVHEEPETPSNVVSPVFGGLRETSAPETLEVDQVDEVAPVEDTAPVEELETPVAEEQVDEPAAEDDVPTDESLGEEPMDEPLEELVEEPVAQDDAPVSEEQVDEPGDEQLDTAWPATAVAEHESPAQVPTAPAVDDGSQWGDNPLGTPAASVEETPAPASAPEEPLAPVALAGATAAPNGVEPRTEAPVRLTIRRPLSATPAASALEGDHVPDAGQPNTPIFGQLRSNWLNDDDETTWGDAEVDRGWNAADRAESADADAEGHTRTGLPVRRPGGRLVPGGVSNEPTVVARDPDAIRNRLAAHAAGVSRGRAAAAAQPVSNDYAHEETGPA